MKKEELDDNLGVIAKGGSLAFKKENELKDGYDIIGQFGVGFYSAFMVADTVTVVSKALGSEETHRWESDGAGSYNAILFITENAPFDFYTKEYEKCFNWQS